MPFEISEATATPPWEKDNPKGDKKHKKLTPEQIKRAKARARKAGRPYPNLVDNMAVAREDMEEAGATERAIDTMAEYGTEIRAAAPRETEYERVLREAEAWTTKKGKNPKGGLNAAGRRSLKAAGHDIKPGVKNYTDASPKDKRRWISWATRFYSNPKGPMVDKNGKPTRLALMATAWGEPVPKTREAAQAIAAKARRRSEALDKAEMREGATTDTDNVDEGMLAGMLDQITQLAKAGDMQALADYIGSVEWNPEWDESIDDMTYEGREEVPALLRAIMKTARAAGGKPTAEALSAAIS